MLKARSFLLFDMAPIVNYSWRHYIRLRQIREIENFIRSCYSSWFPIIILEALNHPRNLLFVLLFREFTILGQRYQMLPDQRGQVDIAAFVRAFARNASRRLYKKLGPSKNLGKYERFRFNGIVTELPWNSC